jgi:antitoxin ParD1/3/4
LPKALPWWHKEIAVATMNVSLPDAMKVWVEEQVASGHYANSSDVIRDLVRQQQLRARQLEELGRIAQAALAGGRVHMSREDLLVRMRQKAEEATARRQDV